MKAIAFCGLACCVCSENKGCVGCQDGGCESHGWCKNYNCCKEKREAVARFHEQEAEERSLRKNLAVQTEEETVKEKQPIPVKDTEPVETKGREENAGDLDILPVTWASSYLPISQIKNGVIQTKDERYIKIIEILPINFLLRSAPEKRNISILLPRI